MARAEKITEGMAHEFMRDLRGMVYGNPEKECGGIMSAAHVAGFMEMTEEETAEYLWAAVRYGYSDRQGGAFVI